MFAFINLYKISWNENKMDINQLITQFVIRFFYILCDDPGKYKKSLMS